MGDVVPFGRGHKAGTKKPGKRRPPASSKAADSGSDQPKKTGNTLCRRGFHKWQIDQDQRFDVRAGRLVTVRRCARCGSISRTLD